MAIQASVRDKNLPKMTFRVYEGTVTVQDSIDAAGRTVENTIVHTTPLVKGDFVKIYSTDNAATPICTKADTDDNNILGFVADDPVMGDPITSTGSASVAQYRKATVKLFGQAVLEVKNDGAGALTAGAQIGYSNATPGYWEAGTPITSAGLINAITLQYHSGTAGGRFPALFGYFGYLPNTG
jgi:hypothetical protein